MSTWDVELRAVRKSFGVNEAVRGVDLQIASGTFVTLLGPSGCGKTTLLRMMAGIEAPSSGEVLVAGRPVQDTKLRDRQTRMVFQSYALFPHMNVAENVAYGLRATGVAKGEIARRVNDALEMIGIPDKALAKPGQLSGGQQQRVALARALVTRPTVLLLDEPLGALDLKMRRRMQAELKALQRGVGITFVYVTHDQEEALALSDRIIVMEAGQVAQDGAPADIYSRPVSPYVADFIGETNLLRVEAAGLGAVLIAGSRMAASPSQHGPGTLTVRPENVRVEEARPLAGDGMGGVAGQVTDVSFLGAFHRVTVRLSDGQTLRADVAGTPPSFGMITVSWQQADAAVFPDPSAITVIQRGKAA